MIKTLLSSALILSMSGAAPNAVASDSVQVSMEVKKKKKKGKKIVKKGSKKKKGFFSKVFGSK
tara:strand:+ start:1107 stop:1295 length:189 start_codon:yes stop_codon:yes gene_type:complete